MVAAVDAGSNRMGVIRKQDEAISSEQVLALIETGEFCWSREHVDRLIGKVMNS